MTKISSLSITGYLQTLAPSILEKIYAHPATCLAIFRLLSPLAQAYVMRTLFIQEPIPMDIVNGWVQKSALLKHQQAMSMLRRLNLMLEKGGHVHVNEVFQNRFFAALCCIPSVTSFGRSIEDPGEKDRQSLDELTRFAVERWEAILHFMVGSSSSLAAYSDKHQNVSPIVLDLLCESGLMARGDDRVASYQNNLHITNNGFQFLLQDINTQIWSFLLHFAEVNTVKMGIDVAEMLNFYFFLGSLEYGKCYSTEQFSDVEISLLQDLRDFGIVYQRKKSSKCFYPTKYASILNTSRQTQDEGTKKDDSFIIIETNYRVYAFTNSPLHISVLGLFTQLKYRFMNFVVGIITRESVRQALSNGITAKQIVFYLRTHAHAQMKSQNPVVPSTVVDQIALWELERNRLEISSGFLYKDFSNDQEYQASVAFAKEYGVLLWASGSVNNRMMFISADGHEVVRNYVKSLIANAQ